MMKTIQCVISLFCMLYGLHIGAQNPDDVTIKTEKLSESVYLLKGAGGNIGVSVGEDGVIVIDDQFAPLTDKIVAAIKTLSDAPLRFLVNTHWHGDHTGGNANMTEKGATIMAHDNVRKRLAETPNRDGSERPKEALPVITFNDELSIHINGETVFIYHAEHAHTDGDAILYFTESNVLHTGDTYFHARYPYIDLDSGGSIDGYINAAKMSLSVINDDTKIIPGHGEVSNKKEYHDFLKMLVAIREAVHTEIKKGKTEEEVANNAALTQMYDDLGYSWNFISSDKFRRTVYKSLKN